MSKAEGMEKSVRLRADTLATSRIPGPSTLPTPSPLANLASYNFKLHSESNHHWQLPAQAISSHENSISLFSQGQLAGCSSPLWSILYIAVTAAFVSFLKIHFYLKGRGTERDLICWFMPYMVGAKAI